MSAGVVRGLGAIDELAVDGGMVCVREVSGRVVCFGELFAPVEVPELNGARGLLLWAARACTQDGAALRCWLPAGGKPSMVVELDDARAISAHHTTLCVLDAAAAVRCTTFELGSEPRWRAMGVSRRPTPRDQR
ncbi:MAG: hypothetical protein SFW67_00710 [Myxococcaceae bacterium]|nr:hypothetical protein [Myxococcaceae bacterium]